MIAVIGATGNTGKIVAETLIARGQKVRAIGRDAKRLETLVQKGAEAFVADASDAAALTQAFAGARAVYLMIPPNLKSPDLGAYQKSVSDAEAQAIEKAGVEHAVLLSSVGADKPDKTGPVVGLHQFEEKLNANSRLNALHIRAGYFMENLLPQVTVIKNFGIVGGPLTPELTLPMIATRDIAAFAAEALLKLDFQGKRAHELLGQRDLDYREATSVIGKAIGKPGLGYSQLPGWQLKMALTSMGMSSSMAGALLEMSDSLNSGYMRALEPRAAANTTPTSFETFVTEQFVPSYAGKAAGA
jgi:uncharacterized protein YbjT (DUF2867 family)